MKSHAYIPTFVSALACSLITLGVSTVVNADITNSSQHAIDDSYWADLAQDYPAFVAPKMAARIAIRNEDVKGQWGPVIPWPHIPVSAANLPDGRILTYSAARATSFPAAVKAQTYSATWDPASNTFIDTLNDGHDMFCAHLSTLEDGRIFVTGGRNRVMTTSTFDFKTNTWTQIDDMNNGRWHSLRLAWR